MGNHMTLSAHANPREGQKSVHFPHWTHHSHKCPEKSLSHPILAFGNPLLDISCHVDPAFFKRYGLKEGSMTLWNPSHKGIYEDLALMPDVAFIAGGSALNSIRVCQWMLSSKFGSKTQCCYIGSIGTPDADLKQKEKNVQSVKRLQTSKTLRCLGLEQFDLDSPIGSPKTSKSGAAPWGSQDQVYSLVNQSRELMKALRLLEKIPSKYLKECIEQDHVFADFLEIPFLSTGTCAVCISDDKERSMVTKLAAGQEFKLECQLKRSQKIKNLLKDQQSKNLSTSANIAHFSKFSSDDSKVDPVTTANSAKGANTLKKGANKASTQRSEGAVLSQNFLKPPRRLQVPQPGSNTPEEGDSENLDSDDIRSDDSFYDDVESLQRQECKSEECTDNEVYSDAKYEAYRRDFFDRMKTRMEHAKIVYAPGFFLNTSVETLLMAGQIQFDKFAKECSNVGSVFAINLSAEFIIDTCRNELNRVLDIASHLFGNDKEVTHYAKVNGIIEQLDGTDDLMEIARVISLRRYPSEAACAVAAGESEKRRPLTVVVTHGKCDTIVAVDGKVESYKVPLVEKTKIVDLNGAGDAFVGGFLSQLVLNKSLQTCVEAGNYAAGKIIQRSGTTLTNMKSPKRF